METQTRTHIYDALLHNNYRSELRLDPNRLYSSSLRLGNLGVDNEAHDLKYNSLSGVYSLIRNIYLMNNSDILDQLYDAHHFLAFNTSVSNENANNFSLWSHFNGNNNAFNVGANHFGDGYLGDGIEEQKIQKQEDNNIVINIDNIDFTFPNIPVNPYQPANAGHNHHAGIFEDFAKKISSCCNEKHTICTNLSNQLRYFLETCQDPRNIYYYNYYNHKSPVKIIEDYLTGLISSPCLYHDYNYKLYIQY